MQEEKGEKGMEDSVIDLPIIRSHHAHANTKYLYSRVDIYLGS